MLGTRDEKEFKEKKREEQMKKRIKKQKRSLSEMRHKKISTRK